MVSWYICFCCWSSDEVKLRIVKEHEATSTMRGLHELAVQDSELSELVTEALERLDYRDPMKTQ